jgi:hypothetical protein
MANPKDQVLGKREERLGSLFFPACRISDKVCSADGTRPEFCLRGPFKLELLRGLASLGELHLTKQHVGRQTTKAQSQVKAIILAK